MNSAFALTIGNNRAGACHQEVHNGFERSYARSRLRLDRIDYVVIAALSALTIYLGTGGGQPLFHPDYVIVKGLLTLQQHGDPNFFAYPGLVIYLNSVMYGVIYGFLRLLGTVAGPGDFQALYQQGSLPLGPFSVPFVMPGVMITALFSVIGVIATYVLALRLTRVRLGAICAAAILSTSFLWAVETHFATVDIPLAALAVATVCVTVQKASGTETLDWKSLALIGILFGLTTSAKYNGGIVFVAIAAAIIVERRNILSSATREVLTILGIGLTTFLFVNPFAVIRAGKFVADLRVESVHQRYGSFGASADNVLLDHLVRNLGTGFGPWIGFLAVLGLVIFLLSKSAWRSVELIAVLFPVSYLIVMGLSAVTYRRYMVPIAPFVAIYAALAIVSVQRVLLDRFFRNRIASVVTLASVLALVSPNVTRVWRHNDLLRGTDTRETLAQTIRDMQAADPGVHIAGRPGHWGLEKRSAEAIRSPRRSDDLAGFDMIVYDSIWHDDYVYQSRFLPRFPQNLAQLYTIPRAFGSGVVIQISPFMAPKELVPYSPDSNFSPYSPDLAYRVQSGPFIEIYCKDTRVADQVVKFAKDHGTSRVTLVPAREGFYFSKPYFRTIASS